jgi:hypothetical protein
VIPEVTNFKEEGLVAPEGQKDNELCRSMSETEPWSPGEILEC